MITAEKMFDSLWSQLDKRQCDILAGRFGLNHYDAPQTLAALGKRHRITRERVRQIENGALRLIKKKASFHPAVVEFVERSKKYFKASGGVAKQEEFLESHHRYIEHLIENHLHLLLEALAVFSFYPEDKAYWSFYYSDQASLGAAKRFLREFENFLQPKKEEILSSSNYQAHFKNFVKTYRIHSAHAETYVKVSKRFHVSPYGDPGLATWAEIKPITVCDHIYLVLKKEQKPLHFIDITKLINAKNASKLALEPTVHNELIKDSRFVLVGRGMYGLTEDGYRAGTARQVIQRILAEIGPMRTREIIDVVQKERFFKPNTVLVNLQNKNFFTRRTDGTYVIRKK